MTGPAASDTLTLVKGVRQAQAESLTLYKHVAVCQQLNGLEGRTVGPNQTLSPLDELLLRISNC